MSEGDQIDLITKVKQAGQRMRPVGNEFEPMDEFRIVVSAAERDVIVSALHERNMRDVAAENAERS